MLNNGASVVLCRVFAGVRRMSGCVGASLVVLALAGCAANRGTVGQSFVPGALGAEIRNASPVSMSAATPIGEGQNAPDAREVTTSTGTGPAGYALANEHEARWWAQNQVQRNIYFKRLPDGALAFNSNTGTDVDIGADEFAIDPATGTIAGKGLRIRTNSSEQREPGGAAGGLSGHVARPAGGLPRPVAGAEGSDPFAGFRNCPPHPVPVGSVARRPKTPHKR